MKTSEDNLWKFLDNCRGSALELKAAVSLVYTLKVWKHAKHQEDLSFRRFYQGELTGEKLTKAFRTLAEHDKLFSSYLRHEGDLARFSPEELAAVFNFVNAADELPAVGYTFTKVFEKLGRYSTPVPDEISELQEPRGRSRS